MPAIGQDTGRTYQETEILEPLAHEQMSKEPLFRIEKSGLETDVLVRPVRNVKAPNFRKMREAILKSSVERREVDPTHNSCVALLVAMLRKSRLKIWSPTFDDEGRPEPFGQVIFSQGSASYEWWQDGSGCRIAAGPENYIQPDICGRSRNVFFPSGRQPNIVIEVINTHPPELETFFALLDYSLYNHLVAFYYVAEDSDHSQYSKFELHEDVLSLRVAHYLLGGKAFRNGEEVIRGGKDDAEWYEHLRQTFFGTPLKNKHP